MAADIEDSRYARFALRCSNFAERWFPDSWVFAALAVIIVAVATLSMGAAPTEAAKAFGDGFWSLIPFTMQMAFVVIGGYVVASSPPAVKLIDRLARIPKNGRSAVAWVALISMVAVARNTCHLPCTRHGRSFRRNHAAATPQANRTASRAGCAEFPAQTASNGGLSWFIRAGAARPRASQGPAADHVSAAISLIRLTVATVGRAVARRCSNASVYRATSSSPSR